MGKNRRLIRSATGIRRTRPTWPPLPPVPCPPLVLDYGHTFRSIGEPKAARAAHEAYKWMNRIRPD
jgi:hypothetical protein